MIELAGAETDREEPIKPPNSPSPVTPNSACLIGSSLHTRLFVSSSSDRDPPLFEIFYEIRTFININRERNYSMKLKLILLKTK